MTRVVPEMEASIKAGPPTLFRTTLSVGSLYLMVIPLRMKAIYPAMKMVHPLHVL